MAVRRIIRGTCKFRYPIIGSNRGILLSMPIYLIDWRLYVT